MTALARILGIALCFLLASAADGWAAGKRKHGKAKPAHHNGAPVERVAEPSPGPTPTTTPGRSATVPTETRASEARPATARESVRQESRIEFDERMLRGQSAAGVIYLFQRSPSDWKSTVEVPDSFRQRTVQVVTPTEDKK
jgi:hypothetical protein